MTAKRNHIAPFVWQICTIAALLALGQWASLNHPAPTLSTLQNIAAGYLRLWHGDLLFTAIIPSMTRLAVGFFIAVAVGCVLGLMLGYLRQLNPWIRPVL